MSDAPGIRVAGASVFLLALAACNAPPDEPHQPATQYFSDVTDAVGLAFTHFSGVSGQYYFSEIMGAGGALLDYDRDGDLDIYLLQGVRPPDTLPDALVFDPPRRPGNRLMQNQLFPRGQLRFEDVTDASGTNNALGDGMGIAVGDIDNDGFDDIYLANFGPNVLLKNTGDGRFTDVTAAAGVQDDRWSSSAAFVDYDLDGDLDLFLASYVSFQYALNKRCNGAGGQRDYCTPLNYQPLSDRLFRNDGHGTFEDVTLSAGIAGARGSGLGVLGADFNGDGWPDIYVANDGRPNVLWINQTDGRFEDAALMAGVAYNANGAAEASMGVAAGDFDGDGDEDLFMTHLANETNTLYLNDGAAGFVDATAPLQLGLPSLPYTGFGTRWLDYQNDGAPDLFVVNGAVTLEISQQGEPFPYRQPDQLFLNHRGEGFAVVAAPAGAPPAQMRVGRGLASGDVDGDGDTDLLVTNNNGPAQLLLNNQSDGNYWLAVQVQGVAANRNAYGARVALVRQDGSRLWRRVHSDGSYLSASDPQLLFGLGQDPAHQALIVHWPGGVREQWPAQTPNTRVTLVQGAGQVLRD